MIEILSYCGLACGTCPIYIATREVDKAEQTRKRFEIAHACREQYGMVYDASDISDCDGCLSDSGRLFSGCLDCSVRACAREKKLKNCAFCSEYICQTLETFFVHDSAAKTRLDEVRQSLS